MAKELYSTNFYPSIRKTNSGRSQGLTEYGYVPDGDRLPSAYLAKITSYRLRTTVIAPIQDSISTRIESHWESFVPTSILNGGNVLLQAVTGGRRALISKATSRRIWMGSTPLVLSLNLKFAAVNDAFNEVTEPVRILQEMALPSEPNSFTGTVGSTFKSALTNLNPGIAVAGVLQALSEAPLLGPPGPSPFTLEGILTAEKNWNDITNSEILEGLKGGDIIRVELGRFLSFWNVILKTVEPTYRITPDRYGNPTGAEVNLVFETYEMMTKESLENAHNVFSFGEPGD